MPSREPAGTISTHDPEGLFTMIIADDGVGFPPDDRQEHVSPGLHFVRLITTARPDGSLYVTSENGVIFKIQFAMNH
ncbi:MAG: hypothetical protein APR53_07360 [Methanoculleus sp. SDB]|nr:MAG: hypothetical protein APR53_07360 [Methanoculleus sp. SDB]